jgi:hypothetical protein
MISPLAARAAPLQPASSLEESPGTHFGRRVSLSAGNPFRVMAIVGYKREDSGLDSSLAMSLPPGSLLYPYSFEDFPIS